MLRKFIIFLLFAPHLLAGVVVRIFTNLPQTLFSLKSNIGECFYVKFETRAQTCISHFGHLDSNSVLQKIGDNSTEESEEDEEVFGTRHGREKRAMRRSFIVRCCGLKTCQGANLRSRTERYKIQCHAYAISNHNSQHRFWLQWRWAVHTISRPNLRRATLWGQYLYQLTDLIFISIIWNCRNCQVAVKVTRKSLILWTQNCAFAQTGRLDRLTIIITKQCWWNMFCIKPPQGKTESIVSQIYCIITTQHILSKHVLIPSKKSAHGSCKLSF